MLRAAHFRHADVVEVRDRGRQRTNEVRSAEAKAEANVETFKGPAPYARDRGVKRVAAPSAGVKRRSTAPASMRAPLRRLTRSRRRSWVAMRLCWRTTMHTVAYGGSSGRPDSSPPVRHTARSHGPSWPRPNRSTKALTASMIA